MVDPIALRVIEDVTVAMIKALPGYPWLPCPICRGAEGCNHIAPERARASGLNLSLEHKD